MKLKGIKDIIKKPYYHVDACPCCGSSRTGYIKKVRRSDYDNEWIVKESLKNGELIRMLPDGYPKNSFCLDCGFEWNSKIKLKMLTLNQIAEQKKKRGTYSLYADFVMEQKRDDKKFKRKFDRLLGFR